MQPDSSIFDMIGIGFGPSNLALAVRLVEDASASQLSHCFIERQPTFGWHRGMLLDDCRMQISFLKDLVTLRDPKSRFTFINYLFERGRLPDFINLKNFYPTRMEFHDYLEWAAKAFNDRVHYGQTVTNIEAVKASDNSDQIMALRVFSRDETGREWERITRALSIGVGGAAQIPEIFAALGEQNVIHTSHYLTLIDQVLGAPKIRPGKRVAVIGAGQSAAEVFLDLTRRFPGIDVSLVTRSNALKPADDSPFANEIFNPTFTDVMFAQNKEMRRTLIDRFRDTNYAVVDRTLIEQIYQMLYLQRMNNVQQYQLLANTAIERAIRRSNGQIELSLRNCLDGHACVERFDALILATGYDHMAHVGLLKNLVPYLKEALIEEDVGRDYRLRTPTDFKPRIYLQGCCESSHGLSDTLLSVLAIRSDEITASLLQSRGKTKACSVLAKQKMQEVSSVHMASAF